MRRILVVLLMLSASAYACSESTDGIIPDGGLAAGDDDGGGGGGGETSNTPGKDGGTPLPDGDIAKSVVLINEVSGGDEWIELVNSGAAPADIAGYAVADRDKDTGGPKLSEAVTFPSGTVLSPRAYLVVRGGGLDGGKPCPDGGQAHCFNAEFGISNKNGETIFLLDDKKAIVGTVVYPADGGGGGGSWGRLPSGDPAGTFQPTKETPGASNVAQ